MFVCLCADVIMSSSVERTDDLVREYLMYRGFTSTLKHLDSEIKADKEKGFRVCLYITSDFYILSDGLMTVQWECLLFYLNI